MLMRLMVAALLLTIGTGGFFILKAVRLGRAARIAGTDPLLGNIHPGLPTILYFTTPDCLTCKYAQSPALEQLKEEMGDSINIVKVDATVDIEAANRWKIRTVPTTYVLNGSGVPVEVNQGAMDAPRLRAQIAAAS